MKQEIDINEIVKIESMAVIKQQLDKVEEFVDDKIKDIPKALEKIKNMSFIEQEDEKGEIKEYKQYLNKIKNELETKRKEIKKEINKPYEEFNEYYSNGVYKKLDNGISQLSDVINEIETLQKDEKQLELVEFFEQYKETYHLNFINFEDIGLNITLSASMTSLKEQIKDFCEKLDKDIKLIEIDDNKDKMMLEYRRNGFDYQKAKLTLIEEQKQLEELKQQMEKKQEIEKQEEKVIEKVQEIIPPKEIIQDEEILESTFTVKATKGKLKLLIEFMNNNGIEVIE